MFAVLQILCVLLVTAGIVVEAVYGAHFGFALITTGSLAFAIATKLRKVELEKEILTSRQALTALLAKKG